MGKARIIKIKIGKKEPKTKIKVINQTLTVPKKKGTIVKVNKNK